MAVREAINRVKIENFRVSRVPVDPTATIYQGDLMMWDEANHRASVSTSGSTSGAAFLGMSETTNPIETAGSKTFLTDSQSARVNVIQQGLVEVIAGEAATVYPYQRCMVGQSPQHVIFTGATTANLCGVVDPAYGAAGKTVAVGDLIRIWLQVPTAYRCLL